MRGEILDSRRTDRWHKGTQGTNSSSPVLVLDQPDVSQPQELYDCTKVDGVMAAINEEFDIPGTIRRQVMGRADALLVDEPLDRGLDGPDARPGSL